MGLEILYQDEYLVAINKPHGLLVHRSPIASDVTEFAVQILRNQIGQYVYPVHRLDRKTSGVLLFALNNEINSLMQQQFMNHETVKKYVTIVRGFAPESGTIDYPLKNENEVFQEAVTSFTTIKTTEISLPSGKHLTSRYSLVDILPKHGRKHQIRKHFAHIMHPIIGDRPHGCNKQNKLLLEKFNYTTMALHAYSLEFQHPIEKKKIVIEADLQPEFE